MDADSWLEKYKPKKIKDIICNRKAVTEIQKWLSNYKKYRIAAHKNKGTVRKRGRGKRKGKNDIPHNRSCMVVTGNHGVGKSVVVDVILKEYGYTVETINFDLMKGSKNMKKFIDNMMKCTNVVDMINKNRKKVAIVLDGIESITSTTQKSCICALQKKNDLYWYCPIIFISNKQHNKMISNIKNTSFHVTFWDPYRNDLMRILTHITKKEGMKVKDMRVYDMILNHSQSDIRRLMNTLFDIYTVHGKKTITKKILKRYIETTQRKDVDIDLYKATSKMLYEYNDIDECLDYYGSHKVLLPLMLHHNYVPTVLSNYSKDMAYKKIGKISEYFSIGDVIENHIYSTMSWDLQEIHGMYTCVKTAYNTCAGMKAYPKKPKLAFSTDLNKTSIQRINKKNIVNAQRCFTSMNVYDYIYINKIVRKMIEDGEIKQCVEIIGKYDIKLDHIESLLKIDKIMQTKTSLSARNRKEFVKYIEKK